jgi:hypothetical protein
VPQGSKFTDLTPTLNKIRWFDSGNEYPAEMPEYRSKVFDRIFWMLSNKECGEAFKRANLPTPNDIINNGLTLAARPVLNDPSNNQPLGISEQVRQAFNESKAPVLTIMPQYTSKGAIIFFRAEAFTDINYLDENLAHEFIHAAGEGQHWWMGGLRGHDLSGYEHYKDIIKNCGYENH